MIEECCGRVPTIVGYEHVTFDIDDKYVVTFADMNTDYARRQIRAYSSIGTTTSTHLPSLVFIAEYMVLSSHVRHHTVEHSEHNRRHRATQAVADLRGGVEILSYTTPPLTTLVTVKSWKQHTIYIDEKHHDVARAARVALRSMFGVEIDVHGRSSNERVRIDDNGRVIVFDF